ncbi:hypothetical protein [Bacillus sp. FJAT-29814]|uniref:hypothetical protein n=1 Tax=Bacillus sp. FJAT-29814 TaxID=1729688 RepID=UPI0012E3EE45|nr:hypothetical protein [Bacillus sp. FJAT-29814]
MTKQEAYSLMVLIEKVYPMITFRNEIVEYWFQYCAEMEYETMYDRISAYIRCSPYPPRLEEIVVYTNQLQNELSFPDPYILK